MYNFFDICANILIMKKTNKTKENKILMLIDWLKFISLFCIILPLCVFIFQGFSFGGLYVIIFGFFLFFFNIWFAYFYNKKLLNKQQKNNKIKNK